MKNSQVKLFKDLDTYTEALPSRQIQDKMAKLHEQPYFAHPEDISRLARNLFENVSSKGQVKYICSPPESGKSASILHAFLASDKFTHYVYIACANNGPRNFTFIGELPEKMSNHNNEIAQQQGAAFMLECVQTILDQPEGIVWPRKIQPKELMPVEQASEAIAKLLEPLGEDAKVLFHIDEHKQMCIRSGNFAEAGAMFSRGAMTSLTIVNNVRVVATFTEPLDSVPSHPSSQVCRLPIPLPYLDVNALMENVPELKFSPDSLAKANKTQKALFANLKFRLGIKMTHDLLLAGILNERKTIAKDFLEDFDEKKIDFEKKIAEEPNKATGALCKCVIACKFNIPEAEFHENAAQLLCGIPDKKIEEKGLRQGQDLVALSSFEISASLPFLLSQKDPKIPVYDEGRDLMEQVVTARTPNLFVGASLERAYLWTLSCKAALRKKLKFGKRKFKIEPKKLQAGRIFPSDNTKSVQTKGLSSEIFYYADERYGKATHPLADLFFVTLQNELVLINITGTVEEVDVHEKFDKLEKFIDKHNNKKRTKYELFGVVLAPCLYQEFVPRLTEEQASTSEEQAPTPKKLAPTPKKRRQARRKSLKQAVTAKKKDFTERVCAVTGDEAQQKLGGLRQMFRWMVPKEQVPEEQVSEEQVPKEQVPEEQVPEEQVPEEQVPEEQVPEEQVPKEQVPEEQVPEEQVPEEQVPEEQVPEEQVPKEQVPEEQVPKMTEE